MVWDYDYDTVQGFWDYFQFQFKNVFIWSFHLYKYFESVMINIVDKNFSACDDY